MSREITFTFDEIREQPGVYRLKHRASPDRLVSRPHGDPAIGNVVLWVEIDNGYVEAASPGVWGKEEFIKTNELPFMLIRMNDPFGHILSPAKAIDLLRQYAAGLMAIRRALANSSGQPTETEMEVYHQLRKAVDPADATLHDLGDHWAVAAELAYDGEQDKAKV